MTDPAPESGPVSRPVSGPASGPTSGSTDGPEESRKRKRGEKKPLPLWQESLVLLGIALALAILIKLFFVQAFYIPSPSMEPQFVKNDRILVEKVSYWGDSTPQRGDVVVFEDPGGWLSSLESQGATNIMSKALEAIGLYPSGGHLVKRVIGIGGDHVVCCDKQGRVTINGTALDETSYLPKGTPPSTDDFDVIVPEGKMWVMGDNRSDSFDSRGHRGDPGGGYVATTHVVGKVWALIWPWKRAEMLDRPPSFEAIPAPR